MLFLNRITFQGPRLGAYGFFPKNSYRFLTVLFVKNLHLDAACRAAAAALAVRRGVSAH